MGSIWIRNNHMGKKKKLKNILIFLPYGIGDIIMSIPALKRLYKVYDYNQVFIVISNNTQKELLNFLINNPTNTLIYRKTKFINLFKLYFKICKINPEFIYAPLINNAFSRILFFLSTTKRTFIPLNTIPFSFLNLKPSKFSLETFEGHQVNYYINFFNQGHNKIPLHVANHTEIKYDFPSNIFLKNKQNLNIVIGISCGIFERHKIPSPKYFADLINKLSNSISCKFYVIGNTNDISLINEFLSHIQNKKVVYNIINDNITETLQSMSNYDLGITGTTGQGHMMSIGSFPLLVLAGVTEPLESGPYAERVKILKHNLDCGPCYQATYKYGCKQIQCMDMLNMDLAVNYVLELINNGEFGKNWLLNDIKKMPTSQIQIQKVITNMKNSIHD
jgi:ADP-heptose:LPS heptosyltransferase